jgi:hypothetical protein
MRRLPDGDKAGRLAHIFWIFTRAGAASDASTGKTQMPLTVSGKSFRMNRLDTNFANFAIR